MAELTSGLPTAEQLRTDPSTRAGLSTEQLLTAGLTATEASTIGRGFSEAFGENRAKDFRAAEGLTVDEFGVAQNINVPIGALKSQQALNPQIPANAQLTPTLQTVGPGETLTAQTLGASPTTTTPSPIGTAQEIHAQQVSSIPQVNAESIAAGVQPQSVSPVFTSPVETLDPAVLNISNDALVENRLATMFADIESGVVPPWAKAAHNQAMAEMSARGLQGSSIAAGAISLALMQSALPIAAADAQTYFQADMANFEADQQSRLVNFQARQQNMLTDVSIANASEQFNAANKSQTQQFVANLIGSIKTSNANMIASVQQFNVSQANSVSAQNAGNQLAVDQFDRQMKTNVEQFNANIQNQREQFNANMRFAVDQSNVLWRRNVNTGNTAAVNAANQVNTQNMFNMSQQAQNDLWQQQRDEAAWLFSASQNQLDRDYNLAMAAGNRDFVSRNDDRDYWTDLGQTINLGGVWDTVTNFVTNEDFSDFDVGDVDAAIPFTG